MRGKERVVCIHLTSHVTEHLIEARISFFFSLTLSLLYESEVTQSNRDFDQTESGEEIEGE